MPKEVVSDEERRQRSIDANSARWERWYIKDTDIDDWFFGWCPIHDDEAKDTDKPTAQFNFVMGSFRCLTKPRVCHDGKRGLSLVNVAWRFLETHAPAE